MSSATTPALTADEAEPLCPLRPGRACALCVPGASGPENCGLVYLVTSDPTLRARLTELWAEYDAARRDQPATGPISASASRS